MISNTKQRVVLRLLEFKYIIIKLYKEKFQKNKNFF
jgi:hypothetical protein